MMCTARRMRMRAMLHASRVSRERCNARQQPEPFLLLHARRFMHSFSRSRCNPQPIHNPVPYIHTVQSAPAPGGRTLQQRQGLGLGLQRQGLSAARAATTLHTGGNRTHIGIKHQHQHQNECPQTSAPSGRTRTQCPPGAPLGRRTRAPRPRRAPSRESWHGSCPAGARW